MDNLENVEDLTLLWNFDESFDDYLKKQLHQLTCDLEEARKEAIEQAKINKENIKKLIHLLGIAYKERDEARNQLHELLMIKPHTLAPRPLPTYQEQPGINPVISPTTFTSNQKTALSAQQQLNIKPIVSQIWTDMNIRGHTRTCNQKTALPTQQLSPIETNTIPTTMSPKSPLMMVNSKINIATTKPNSSMTNHSNTTTTPTSSSIDSFFDVGSSPGYYDNPNCANSSYDQTCTMLDNIAKGRPRPEKGKLLQAVMEAGPLLDSLLMAGSLPKWMNSPDVGDAPQVPPVPISMNKRPRYCDAWETGPLF